jgi:hypothetical protein
MLLQAFGSLGIITIPLLDLAILLPLKGNAKVNNYVILM